MKRILRNFRITEISAVDRPAQEHAKVALMKRETERSKPKMSMIEQIQQAGRAAEGALDVLAHDLRKREPALTKEQAFAKVYTDLENAALVKAERQMNRPGGYPPVARTEPVVGATDGYAELVNLAADFRRQNPFLTPEQAFARIYSDPANRDLVSSERAAARERLYAGGTKTNISGGLS